MQAEAGRQVTTSSDRQAKQKIELNTIIQRIGLIDRLGRNGRRKKELCVF